MAYSDYQKLASRFGRAHRRRQLWLRTVTAMACVVVFITTYALILPAITADAADLKQYLFDSGGSLSAQPDIPDLTAIPDSPYPLCLCITGGEQGFSPGIYFYKLPEGTQLLTTTGRDLVSPDNRLIGSWSVNDNETVVLDLNEYAAVSDIELQLDLIIAFDGTRSTVDFDGGTSVSVASPAVFASAPVDMKEYIESIGGSITIGVYDSSGTPVDNTVVAGERYKISLGLNTGDGGFSPGTYIYSLPEGVLVDSQAGQDLVLSDGTVIGSWSVAQDGQVIFNFNENANSYQNVTLALDLIVKFDATQGDIEFDGDINVTITPAPEKPVQEPEVEKWGEIETEDDGTRTMTWSLNVQGGEGFPLPGQTITDTITSDNHAFNPEDKDFWVNVWADDDTYYSWEIREEDAIWSEDGKSWTYTIPQTITCIECNDPAHFANGSPHEWGNGENHEIVIQDDWKVSVYVETVFTDGGVVGTYGNSLSAGGMSDEHTVELLPPSEAGVTKTGKLVDGQFQWTLYVTIPGGETASYYWYLSDSIRLEENSSVEIANDLDKAVVTMLYGDETVTVPYLAYATADDPIAYKLWSSSDASKYDEMTFLHQCSCTESTCVNWNTAKNRCGTRDNVEYNDKWINSADGTVFCKCWHETEDITFTITYATQASADIISEYGGMGEQLRNQAELRCKSPTTGQTQDMGESRAYLPIPGVFNKNLLSKPGAANQYTAEFNITVNEEMQDLSAMEEKDITIVDKMSETLFYEAGSMVVRQTDTDGNTVVLHENQGYTVTMVSSHQLEIKLLNPGPYKYTLDYRCVLDLTGYTGQPIEYNNSAEIWLFGTRYTVGGETEILTSYTTSAERYTFQIEKRDFHDNSPLPGAVFGLYNELGNLITTATTDTDGNLTFETDMENGVIFRKDTPYYILELQAPPGYGLDDTKRWFYFAKTANEALENNHPGILHIGQSGSNTYSGTLQLTNEHYMLELPETGSFGEITFYALSAAAFAAALLTGGGVLLRRKKHPRQ